MPRSPEKLHLIDGGDMPLPDGDVNKLPMIRAARLSLNLLMRQLLR